MSQLLAFNLTGTARTLALPTGVVVTLPLSAAPPARGNAYDVTDELRGLTSGQYDTLRTTDFAAPEIALEWVGDPEYATNPALDALIGGPDEGAAVTITPADITSPQDDYEPTGWAAAGVVLLTATGGNHFISGFAAVVPGEGQARKFLFNLGSLPIDLSENDDDSIAANRILGPGNEDYIIQPATGVWINYAAGSAVWIVEANSSSQFAPSKATADLATAAVLPAYTRTGNTILADGNNLLTVDGVATLEDMRLVLDSQHVAAPEDAGIWLVNDPGDGSTQYELERSDDCDTEDKIGLGFTVLVGPAGSQNAEILYQAVPDSLPFTLNVTELFIRRVVGWSEDGWDTGEAPPLVPVSTGTMVFVCPSGTTGDVNFVLEQPIIVIDGHFRKTDGVPGGDDDSSWQVTDGSNNPVSNEMNFGTEAVTIDDGIMRFKSVNDANTVFAAGATIRMKRKRNGTSANEAGVMVLTVIRDDT